MDLTENYVMLACAIIEQARIELEKAVLNDDYSDYLSSVQFFRSEWFTILSNRHDNEYVLKEIIKNAKNSKTKNTGRKSKKTKQHLV